MKSLTTYCWIATILIFLMACQETGRSSFDERPVLEQLERAFEAGYGSPEEAVAVLDSLIPQLEPGDSLWCLAQTRMATALAAGGELSRATERWKLATESCSGLGLPGLVNFANHLLESEALSAAYTVNRAAIQQAQQAQDSFQLIQAYQNAAAIHYRQNELDSTRNAAQQALRLAQQTGSNVAAGRAMTTLSVVYSEWEKADSALLFAKQALQTMNQGPDKLALVYALSNVGLAFETASRDDSALVYYELARKRGEANQQRQLLPQLLYNESYCRYRLGQFEHAFDQYDRATTIQDSLNQSEYRNTISELQIKYRTAQQEQELQQLEKDREQAHLQRNILLALVIGILLISSLIYVNIRQQKRLAEAEVKRLNKEQEVLALQSTLMAQESERQRIARDLHDSIGALLSTARVQMAKVEEEMQKLAELDLLKNTEKIIVRASKEVRRLAHNMMPSVLIELGFTEGIEEFLGGLRHGDGPTFSFDYDELEDRLPQDVEIMLYRIVQELVQNTLKHASATEVHLEFRKQAASQSLLLEYRDNGRGFPPELWQNATNLGLSNIKSRTSYLKGTVLLDTGIGKGMHLKIRIPWS